jgi:hypothetical protein
MRDDAARALRAYEEMLAEPYERKFDRSSGSSRARAAATALRERPAAPVREYPSAAPGRAYGTHRRTPAPPAHVRGPQPGRRTVEITGHVQAPRRRSQTRTAMVARPDRTAQWAFLFALFLLVMAIATAHG